MFGREETRETDAATNSEWHRLAPRKQPDGLHDLLLHRVSALVGSTTSHHQSEEELRSFCEMLSTSLPLGVRTSIMKKVTSAMTIKSSADLKALLLIHLLLNVRQMHLRAEDALHLDQETCDNIKQMLKGEDYFRLEVLRLEGITAEEGLLSFVLRRSPCLRSVHVSGELCSEVLSHLRENPCDLRSLQLDSCTVCDEEVVRALVGTGMDFQTLGNFICSGQDVKELEPAALHSLRSLSVESPRLSPCGALVLLASLPNLQQIQYTAWSSPIADTLLFLKQLNPTIGPFSITSLAQWRPTEETLRNLQKVCPRLKSLMMECYDPALSSLDVLSEYKELTHLNLRLVSEELIVSAVKALGKQLLELVLEFEEYTYHSISVEAVRAIQEHCPHLQRLEMKHVNITSNPGDHISLKNASALPQLKHLILSSAVVQPASLERLLKDNKALETLVLDVNQDALTDSVLGALIRNNHLQELSSIFLGAGSLSVQALLSLLALPELRKLSLDLKRFPFIPFFAFASLESSLTKGNFQCVLENVIRED